MQFILLLIVAFLNMALTTGSRLGAFNKFCFIQWNIIYSINFRNNLFVIIHMCIHISPPLPLPFLSKIILRSPHIRKCKQADSYTSRNIIFLLLPSVLVYALASFWRIKNYNRNIPLKVSPLDRPVFKQNFASEVCSSYVYLVVKCVKVLKLHQQFVFKHLLPFCKSFTSRIWNIS